MKKHLNSKKVIALVFAPILIVLMVVGFFFGFKFKNEQRNSSGNEIVNNDVSFSYAKVYLKDNDNVLLPLTIKYQTPDCKAEEMMYIISLLKKDSQIANKNFNGLLPSECKVNSLTLNNNILNINFDDEFLNYEAKDELRLLESLVWSMTDLDYVDQISLSINDKLLKNMPLNNTPLNKKLNKEIGINNLLLTSSIIGVGQQVLSYYEKKIENNYYYIPVTHYVNNKNDLSIYDLTIQTLFKEPGITSSLQVCRCLKETQMVSASILKDDILYLSLSEDILFDELTVSYDVYMIMKEVTCLLNDVKDVSFLMDLEEVMVNGFDDEQVMVSKVELNKYYI